jgi:hypothetical protein
MLTTIAKAKANVAQILVIADLVQNIVEMIGQLPSLKHNILDQVRNDQNLSNIRLRLRNRGQHNK